MNEKATYETPQTEVFELLPGGNLLLDSSRNVESMSEVGGTW